MFANKKLYLPSINEIKNLVYNKKKKKNINATNLLEIKKYIILEIKCLKKFF